MTDRARLLRRAGLGSVLGLFALGSLSTLAFLWPPAGKVQPDTITATERIDYRTGIQESTRARLVQQGFEWTGTAAEFPVGSLTRFQPQSSPSFFVAHFADGSWSAFADRSPFRGFRIKWVSQRTNYFGLREERTIGIFCEPTYGDCYSPDGQMISGPGPQPLVPFPLSTTGDQVRIGVQPQCPANPPYDPRYHYRQSAMPSLHWWIC